MLFRKKNKLVSIPLPALSFCSPDTDGLRLWISQLPKNNDLERAEALLKACRECTTLEFDAAQLLATVQTIEQEIFNIAESLSASQPSKIYRIHNYGLQQQFFSQFGQLLLRAYIAFSHTKSQANENYLRIAVKFLSRSIFISNKLYCETPTGCWKALHRSHKYLEKKANGKKDNIKALGHYRAIAALNCLNPQQIPADELDVFFDYLLSLESHIHLSNQPNDQSTFEIKLTEDFGPQKYNARETNNHQQVDNLSIYINLEQLIDADYEDHYQTANQYLNKVLKQASIRQIERNDLKASLDICTGIFTIHQKVSNGKPLEEFVSQFSKTLKVEKLCFISKETDLSNSSANDIWSTAYRANLDASFNESNVIEFEARPTSTNGMRFSQDVTCVNTLNCSLTGLCIHGDNHSLSDFIPGALIGLQRQNEAGWAIADIRWTKASNDRRQLGVEIIGNDINPCAIKIIHSKQGTDFLPALHIPYASTKFTLQQQANALSNQDINSSEQQLDWLIFPNTGLHAKASAILLIEGKEQRIILSDCIERSDEYCIYGLQKVDHQAIA